MSIATILDFAVEFYRDGAESFSKLGGRVGIDGKLYSHSQPDGLCGGFLTSKGDLKDAWGDANMTVELMRDRIDSMDAVGEQMRKLAVKMAGNIRKATSAGYDKANQCIKKTKGLIAGWDGDIDRV